MCSAPLTPSIVSTCGHVLWIPRGIVEPWKSIISWYFALAVRIWSYHCIRTCCSERMWSTFNPTTPQDFQSLKLAPISFGVGLVGWFVQIHTPTCFLAAYLTSVGTQLGSQPASTSTYSQPIFAAKSA